MVYALLVQKIEAQVAAERQVAAVFLAAGAKGVTLPTVGEAVAELDAQLLAEPKVVDGDRAELLAALGVGRV